MGLGFNKGTILTIMMVFVVTYFVLCIIFRYLIRSNKIKPNKITKIFYLDDDNFIIDWEEARKKGKYDYILYTNVMFSIVLWSTSLFIIFVTDGDFLKLNNTLPIFFGTIIGNTAGTFTRWKNNENKFEELTKDKVICEVNYKRKNFKKVMLYLTVGLIVFLVIQVINIREYLPLDLDYANIKIETPDSNNPTEKLLTYKIQAENKSKRIIKFKYYIIKDKNAESWYPYYNIIPENYVSNIEVLNPNEMKEYSIQITVNSDDERLITSNFHDINVQYEVIHKGN